MAYFLKQTHRGSMTYLAIYDSFWDPERKQPRNRCVKSLGSLRSNIENGIADPIAYYKALAAAMEEERKEGKAEDEAKKIGKVSAERHLGYFPLHAIMQKLDVKEIIDIFQSSRDFKFSVFECLSALIYARAVKPASKLKTTEEVIPCLFGDYSFSYDQILSCLEFLGTSYDKIVELFTRHTGETYVLDTSQVLFDATNYYFEIDAEDSLKRKGPSKERRTDPIVGMGLLLDKNCIPIGMKLYPGNESEKPKIREVIKSLKKRSAINGRTVQVADKGLNCARNIVEAVDQGDGYLFSRSVKTLNAVEKKWVFNDDDLIDVYSQDTGKLLYSYKWCVDEFTYSYVDENERRHRRKVKEKRLVTFNPKLKRKQTEELKRLAEKGRSLCHSRAKKEAFGESSRFVDFVSKDKNGEINDENAVAIFNEERYQMQLGYCGYNMLITSEIGMSPEEIYDTYHQLWRIEESFRTLKSELEARPVYLQKKERIYGHFLICYLTILLERLFQFKVLENRFGTEKIFEFIRNFNVVETKTKDYINLAASGELIEYLDKKLNLPLCNLELTDKQIKKVLNRMI